MSLAVGVTIFTTDRSIGPADVAREAEARGFESLFVPEHTHIPTSRRTPYPAGEPLPDEYRRTFDPFVALTAAAAVTERITLGTGICLVAQHHPINAAKATASLDVLSNGRFVFGVGFGWNVDEMEGHGVDPKRRRAQAREHVLAIKSLWVDEEASFDGEFVHLPPSWSWPKPVQRPHPPILIGGAAGPTLFQHIVEYADGWVPIGAHGLRDNLPKLRALAEGAGRDPRHGRHRRPAGTEPARAAGRPRRRARRVVAAIGAGRRGVADPRPLRRTARRPVLITQQPLVELAGR